MVTYAEVHSAIQSALQAEVEAIIPSVAIGAKTPPDVFPYCLIIPGTDLIEPDSNRSDQHMMDYIIAIVIENENVEAGVQSIIELGGQIYDALTNDYTLGGVVDEVYPRRVDPRFAEGDTYTRHWVMIQLTCRKQMGR